MWLRGVGCGARGCRFTKFEGWVATGSWGAELGQIRRDLHIDGSQTTVSDGTADGTGKGESGVQSKTAQLAWRVGLGLLDDSFNLGRHCDLCSGLDGGARGEKRY
jgi:hypothetical protein